MRAWPSDVAALAPRVFELSELLVDELGVEDVGATFAHRVTYHPTCHSLRLLEVGDRPLRLLRAVRDIDLVELPDARECCGFGGTFAVKNADTSSAILTDKLRHVMAHARRGLRRRRQLVSHAHGRRPAAAARGRADDAPRRGAGEHRMSRDGFPAAARLALGDAQMRRNVGKATTTIRAKRAAVVAELPDWQQLRDAGAAIKAHAMATLPEQLERLEAAVGAGRRDRPLGARRRRGQRDRVADRARSRRARGDQGQVDGDRRDRPQRRARRRRGQPRSRPTSRS